MDLYEYQGKELLKKFGVPTLQGIVAETPEDTARAAEELASEVVAVKAQVLTGGRGKAGGVRVVRGPAEAGATAREILGMDIKEHRVSKVLVEAGANIEQELYLSITVDRSARCPLILFSRQGGMDIEEVASTDPGALVRMHIDPLLGLLPYQVRKVTFATGLEGGAAKEFGKVLQKLYQAFTALDANLIEINPLAVTREGAVLALDAKVTVDESALFRHSDIAAMRDVETSDPQEQRAREVGLQYVKLKGDIGILGNGAGLVMSTLDVVDQAGGSPANFCDVGGGASAEKISTALEIVTSNRRVKAVLFNIFGGITRGDEVARGLIDALERVHLDLPIVVRLDGTNAVEGREILAKNKPQNVYVESTMLGAAKQVVQLATKEGR